MSGIIIFNIRAGMLEQTAGHAVCAELTPLFILSGPF